MANSPPFKVHQIGEVAIRCGDIDAMMAFYRDCVGLEIMADFRAESGIVFFKVTEGFNGHTTVLALFAHDAGRADIHDRGTEPPETGARSSLHHLALSVRYEEQDAIMAWLEAQNIPFQTQIFDWVGWRGIFIRDPEGNTVEFVAADASLLKSSEMGGAQ